MKKSRIILMVASLLLLPACSTKPVDPPPPAVDIVVIQPSPELLVIPDKPAQVEMVFTKDILLNKNALETALDICHAQIYRIAEFFSKYNKK